MTSTERTRPGRASWVRRVVFGSLVLLLFVVGGTAFRVWQVARDDDREHADVIVVLGAAQYNGRPSEIFQARLAKAKQLYEAGVASTIVTAGGKKAEDNYTEAEAGALWLQKRGVPVSATLAVGEGSDTLRSMRAVAGQVRDRGWHTVVLVSDPWHSYRARTMADDLGLEAWASPTHSGPIVQARETQIKYIVRETGALLFYRLTKTPADDLFDLFFTS
ncbi:YdcF family protein [Amycolatopsis sp. H20-H5]|uniref:YdcF family protein n=1 Tax=Amycolatopsis sp. H20-H5 TaxID=3046309 RepID=UPI002DBEF149|nr:YdcF family protein [Amycolatopsis sp. H20-H5]MEC3977191.1 YdcF family protein [Amycolatopsis sp. H20-H5]